MADTKITNWYIKTNQEPLGPFTPQELIQQACTGNILGNTELSSSTDGPWLAAENLEAMEMEWQVTPEEGEPLPRCHALALRNWVEEETVQPYWDILHIPSGEVYNVVDALCSALLAQNRFLEDRLSPGEEAVDSENPAKPMDLRMEADRAKKESAKWKRLYEDEISRNEAREQDLLQDNETLRAWQRKAAERIKALERRQVTLDETRQLANSLEDFSGDRDLAIAYEELKLQMTHLLDSLQLKSRQLDESREQARELKLSLRAERKAAEEKVDRVSELHEDTLDQLNRIEQAHVHLSRSFRDLNSKLIQLRNKDPEGKNPLPPSAPAAVKSERSKPAPNFPAKPGGAKGKIKMT